MSDQANALRNLVSREASPQSVPSARAARLVVIAGAKGGVGATTLAVNLAVCLARLRHRAVLVDADPSGGDAALLCQIEERYTIADVLAGGRDVSGALQSGPAGVQVLAGAWEPDVLADPPARTQHHLIEQLCRLPNLAELVIADVGNTWSRSMRRWCQAADAILLVTTTSPASLMAAYATVKLMAAHALAPPVELVVNKAADACGVEAAVARLATVCRRFLGFAPPLRGYVPWDAHVATAGAVCQPLITAAPDCPAARQLWRLAQGMKRKPDRPETTEDGTKKKCLTPSRSAADT